MAFWTVSRWLHVIQRSGLSLIHNRRRTLLGFCWYHPKIRRERWLSYGVITMEKMAKAVHAQRLEGVDKNIWVEFASLAATYKTVNLGQGFPNFSPPDFIRDAFAEAVGGDDSTFHQYTRAFGHPRLVEILARFFGKLLQQDLDPLKNVLVTVGAYEALFCCFQALVDKGDEVIIIEPFFDCYEPMVKMAGGKPVFIPLRLDDGKSGKLLSSRDWRLDATELESKFTKQTKALVLNSPNNPLGKVHEEVGQTPSQSSQGSSFPTIFISSQNLVSCFLQLFAALNRIRSNFSVFSKGEMELIATLCVKYDVLCFSDEVYEWLTYDSSEHIRIASLPGMWERTVSIGSAGKSFSATGWKVGWAIGADRLLKHLRTVHQNSIYHCATAAQQEAVARGMEKEFGCFGQPESYFVQLRQQLQQKRDHLIESLLSVGLKPIVPEGTYFLIADFSAFQMDLPPSEEPYDFRFAKWMIKNKGLAAIPVSAFYSLPQKKSFDHFIRFCFAKEDSTLKAAGDILKQWSQEMQCR